MGNSSKSLKEMTIDEYREWLAQNDDNPEGLSACEQALVDMGNDEY
jgi:hypothetical protein